MGNIVSVPPGKTNTYLPYRPGFKRQLKAHDVTAKYCIYDKVPSLPMSFCVRIKGCVNCCTTTSLHEKNAYSRAESFSHWERFLKTTASLSNLIPPSFYNNMTSLVSVS